MHNFFNISNESIKTGLLDLIKNGEISNYQEYILDKKALDDYKLNLDLRGNLYLLPCETDLEKLKKMDFDTTMPLGAGYFDTLVNTPARIGDILDLDYVFIDARTGYTDPTIASFLAAEIIVILFRLNKQNINGIKDLAMKARLYLSDKTILYCASSIPHIDSRDEKIKDFENEVGIKINFIIPYDSDLEFEEKISILDLPDSNSAKIYEKFANILEGV